MRDTYNRVTFALINMKKKIVTSKCHIIMKSITSNALALVPN